MFQKIANVLSILSFIMVTSVIGGGYFGYKYVTSEQFKAKIMNQVMGNVKGMMPNVLIEVGFITNKDDAALLSKAQYKREISKGLFESILDFKKKYERK